MATPLPPRTPGDRREDYARRIADVVAAVYRQAEQTIVVSIAALTRRVAAGLMAARAARKRLADTVRSAFAVLGHRVRDVLAQARLPVAVHEQLTQALDAAADIAAASAGSALDTAIDAAEQAAPAPQSPTLATPLSLPRLQAAQKALAGLGAQGLTGHVDQAGRHRNLTGYAEMATRTAVSNAWDDLQTQAAIRSGIDLVIVATHSTEGSCPRCLPWLGATLSLSGATPGHPTLSGAKAAGFRHPNCRCFWTPLGASTTPADPVSLEHAAALYKASQRQRALERHIRAAHREMAAAVTPAARGKARRALATAEHASAEHRRHH